MKKQRINGNNIDKKFKEQYLNKLMEFEKMDRRNKSLNGHYKTYLKLREEIKLCGSGIINDTNWKNYKNYHRLYKMFNSENGKWKQLIECGTLKSDN